MECSAPINHLSATYTLKQVLGKGREERWHYVEEIFKAQITPLYGLNESILSNVLNGSYRCRVVYSGEAPSGLLIYDKAIESVKNAKRCLEVKVFHITESENEDKPLSSYVLKQIIRDAKDFKASSIAIRIPNQLADSINFFKQHQFEAIPTDDQNNQLLELFMEKTPASTLRSPLDPPNNKRQREEDEKNHVPKRIPFRIPIPGQENSEYKRQKTSSESPSNHLSHGVQNGQRQKPKLTTTTIQKKYLEMIRNGRKTIEGRVKSGMFGNLNEGQNIQFFCQEEKVLCQITKVNVYNSFAEMLDHEDYRKCIPDTFSSEDAVRIYNSIKSYPERAATYGVVAIHLRKI